MASFVAEDFFGVGGDEYAVDGFEAGSAEDEVVEEEGESCESEEEVEVNSC